MFRVLAIDGGGMRGLIPARVLAEIEDRAGRPICQLFDLVAGTSTGALVALSLLRPGRGGRPYWTAAQLAAAYEADGPSFFPRSPMRALWTVGGLLAAKYSAKPLEAQLRRWLGDTMLSDALTGVLLISYDLRSRRPFLMGTSAVSTGRLPDVSMALAGRCSSAGPSFYPPAVVKIGGVERWCADGALTANNPALFGLTEAQASPARGVTVVSLGTGAVHSVYTGRGLRRGGSIAWLDVPRLKGRLLTDVMIDGSSDATHEQLARLLPRERYFRFNPELPAACEPIDDTSTVNMRRLADAADAFIELHSGRLDDAIAAVR